VTHPTRYLIGALSGWAYADRRKLCLETWFPDAAACGMDAVFLLGEPAVLKPERHGPLLILPCPDAYRTLPQRTWQFVRWALARDDWDYLFKCDDDTYVSASRLAAYDPQGRDYIGAEWRPNAGYGSGGAGYLLSRRAAEIVAGKTLAPLGAEDQLVGMRMRENGIPLTIDPRFVPWGSEERRPRADNDLITAHKFGDSLKARHGAEEAQRLAVELWKRTSKEMR
jgi:hypothetical protein